MIYEQTNLLKFITDNMAEYKAWLIAQYAAQSITVTIPALQYTGIYDTLDCQMPALSVLDGGKDPMSTNSGNAIANRDGNYEIYIISREIDQQEAEKTILLYGEILEQMFIDVYNGFKTVKDLRNVRLGSWTPFEIAVQRKSGTVDTYKAGRQIVTAQTNIFPRRT
jgi:hypothetical protein